MDLFAAPTMTTHHQKAKNLAKIQSKIILKRNHRTICTITATQDENIYGYSCCPNPNNPNAQPSEGSTPKKKKKS